MFNIAVRAVVLGVWALAAAGASAQTATVACGGESQNEFTRMMGDEKNHALLLLYVSRDAAYLSDVETRIENVATGKAVAQAPNCGPLGLVDVSAPGNYRITALRDGKPQSREVALEPKGGKRLMFMWEN